MNLRLRRFLLLASVVLPAFHLPADPAPSSFAGPANAGELSAPPRNEASGITASRRSAELLWTHDDSGGDNVLFAVDTSGKLRTTLRIDGTRNIDWEDIASVDLDGKAWLVIGDIGDNTARRSHLELHLVAEPAPGTRALNVHPEAILRVTFADGPRDCESLALDPRERAIYLLSKRDLVPRLYRVQLPPGPIKSADCTAEFVGPVPALARPTAADALFAAMLEKGRARPCGMDFAADGSAAVVVTYADVVVYPRAKDESWAAAFAREPVRLPAHDLPQAEGVCFSRDGSAIYVVSEQTRTLVRYDRRK